MNILSRAVAVKLLHSFNRSIDSEQELLSILRNYEIEMDLHKAFNEDFVIGEWCPFNGYFCSWIDYAPVKMLTDLQEDIRLHSKEIEAAGRNPSYLIEYFGMKIKGRV